MKRIFLIGTLLVFTSCATSKIASNKASDFNEKISRLFVMVKGSDGAKSFFERFTTELDTSLAQKGIESKTYYIDPLSLAPENEINEEISSYKPNLTMVINQTEARHNVNPYGFSLGYSSTNTGATFDVKIFQPNSKTPVWRANLTADSQFGLEVSARKACEKLIDKLIEDKLL